MKLYDKEFVKRLTKADKTAQKQLFEQLYAPMFRICYRYIAHRHEAEDCTMKGFLKVFQQVGKFEYENPESLFWWVRKIMVNESLMTLRKKHNLYLVPQEEVTDVGIEAHVWSTLHAEDINKMVMQLPAGYRTVFCLHVIEGYGHKEIAEMLGIAESTSKTQLINAKARLKKILTQMNLSYGNVGR